MTYRINPNVDPQLVSISCLICYQTSYDPKDVLGRRCPFCQITHAPKPDAAA